MAEKTKVAVSEAASQNSEPAPEKKSSPKDGKSTGGAKTEKKAKYVNPFSYTDTLQQKVVNALMKDGKKSVAQKVMKDTFNELFRMGEKDPIKTFEIALRNAAPTMNIRPKRIGGAVYQIPIEVPPRRQQSLSIRWILEGARSRKGRPMYRRLAQELVEAANESGHAVTKKNEAHRMAQSNKAFAHLAKY
jgi:small subunit ribosomal protein S7